MHTVAKGQFCNQSMVSSNFQPSGSCCIVSGGSLPPLLSMWQNYRFGDGRLPIPGPHSGCFIVFVLLRTMRESWAQWNRTVCPLWPPRYFPLLSASFLPVLRFTGRRYRLAETPDHVPKNTKWPRHLWGGGVLLACGRLLQLFQLRHCGGRIVFPFIGLLASFAFSLRVALAHLSFLLALVYNQA